MKVGARVKIIDGQLKGMEGRVTNRSENYAAGPYLLVKPDGMREVFTHPIHQVEDLTSDEELLKEAEELDRLAAKMVRVLDDMKRALGHLAMHPAVGPESNRFKAKLQEARRYRAGIEMREARIDEITKLIATRNVERSREGGAQ